MREALHVEPTWRERADFIIGAEISPAGTDLTTEQLWARRIGPRTFEVCCIPFFVYNVSLGDIVEVDSAYFVQRVAVTSNRYVFRLYFGHDGAEIRRSLVTRLEQIGTRLEWYSWNLLAIDVSDHERAQAVADLLQSEQDKGNLIYETGRKEAPVRASAAS